MTSHCACCGEFHKSYKFFLCPECSKKSFKVRLMALKKWQMKRKSNKKIWDDKNGLV